MRSGRFSVLSVAVVVFAVLVVWSRVAFADTGVLLAVDGGAIWTPLNGGQPYGGSATPTPVWGQGAEATASPYVPDSGAPSASPSSSAAPGVDPLLNVRSGPNAGGGTDPSVKTNGGVAGNLQLLETVWQDGNVSLGSGTMAGGDWHYYQEIKGSCDGPLGKLYFDRAFQFDAPCGSAAQAGAEGMATLKTGMAAMLNVWPFNVVLDAKAVFSGMFHSDDAPTWDIQLRLGSSDMSTAHIKLTEQIMPIIRAARTCMRWLIWLWFVTSCMRWFLRFY